MPVNWEDPGEARQGLRPPAPKWEKEAAELRAHPGQWGVIDAVRAVPRDDDDDEDIAEVRRSRQVLRSNALRIQRGQLRAFEPPGTFEASTRIITEDDVIKLFARYIGYKQVRADGTTAQVDAEGNELGITPRPPAPRAIAAPRDRTWQPKSVKGRKRRPSPRKK